MLDLERRQLVVHRDPGPDGYRRVTEHGAGELVKAQTLNLPSLALRELLDTTF